MPLVQTPAIKQVSFCFMGCASCGQSVSAHTFVPRLPDGHALVDYTNLTSRAILVKVNGKGYILKPGRRQIAVPNEDVEIFKHAAEAATGGMT